MYVEACCIYKYFINCSDHSKCETCGWRPEVEAYRKAKLREEFEKEAKKNARKRP